MSQTLNNLIQTNCVLSINDQDFSNEVIFEEVLTDSDLSQIVILRNAIFIIVLSKTVNYQNANGVG